VVNTELSISHLDRVIAQSGGFPSPDAEGSYCAATERRVDMQLLNAVSDENPYIHDGRCGVVVGIPAYYARGRRFDSRTVQTFVCTNMSVYIGSWCFYV
jgi:hypothetical protein